MKLLIDTNGYRDFVDGRPEAVAAFACAAGLYLPFIVVAELRAGFSCGRRGRENERTLTRFLNSARVQVLYPDDATSHHHAALFAQLRAQGTPIPTNDIWVAALALQHGLILYSRDAHFDTLPQLARRP